MSLKEHFEGEYSRSEPDISESVAKDSCVSDSCNETVRT